MRHLLQGGINLVNAAKAAGVEHFIMVTSLGTGKFGWPAGACLTLMCTTTISCAPLRKVVSREVLQHMCLLPHTGILNLFGGVLIQKKRAEQALEASGMRYTIVR